MCAQERVLHNKRSHRSEKPVYHNWRKPVCSNEDLTQPKINKSFLKKKDECCIMVLFEEEQNLHKVVL